MKTSAATRVTAVALAAATLLTPVTGSAWFNRYKNPEEPIVRWWEDGLTGRLYFATEVLRLNSNNLIDTNTNYPASVSCAETSATARTADGSCNDPEQTRMGSRGIRFGRNVELEAAHPEPVRLLEPNPRLVSRALMTRDEIKEVDFLSYWAAAWIQFMTHDWMVHENSRTEFHDVPLDADDPLAAELGPQLKIEKSKLDPTWTPYEGTPPAYTNLVTHWWDGSQLYGSDGDTLASVRTLEGGKLKLDESGRIPLDPATGLPLTGFTDNWWLGLQIFHELFIKEHNAIADMLAEHYPNWSDEQLFNKARLINAAVMAKIHTVDWTPAILKSPTAKLTMNLDWSYVAGGKKNLRGAPFSLTEEFVAVYRMHPLIRDSVDILDYRSGALIQNLPTREQAFHKAPGVLDAFGTDNVYYSFGMTHPGQLTPNNYPRFLQELRKPDGTVVDLAAVDILRDRERGVPRYNEFRRQLNMPPIRDFSDLTPDAELAEKLREVYDGDVEAIDTLVGQLAEGYRPEGFGFSDTTFRIFTMMAPRRFQADRFYTDDFNEQVYTAEGMAWIKDANFRTVLLRHAPELKSRLALVGNPFFPWDTDSCVWRGKDRIRCAWQRFLTSMKGS